MTTRFVTVGDDLTLPASVVVPAGQVDGLPTDSQPAFKSITNRTGATIPANTLVEIIDAYGTNSTVRVADNTTADHVAGITVAEIADGASGNIQVTGTVEGLNTSAFTAGAPLYLGTSGAWTETRPAAPAHIIRVGVAGVTHATAGTVVFTLPAFEILAENVDGLDAKVAELAEDPASELGASLSSTCARFHVTSPGTADDKARIIAAATAAAAAGETTLRVAPGTYTATGLVADDLSGLALVGDDVTLTGAYVYPFTTEEWTRRDQRPAPGHGRMTLVLDGGTDPDSWPALFPLSKRLGFPMGLAYSTSWDRPWVKEVWRHGWEICAHGVDHENMSTKTEAELHALAQSMIASIAAITGSAENINFIYPFHGRSALTDRVLSQYFATGRAVSAYGSVPTGGAHQWVTEARLLDGSFVGGVASDALKNELHAAAATDGRLSYYFHDVTPDVLAGVEDLVRYARTLGVAIVRPSEVFGSLAVSPPTWQEWTGWTPSGNFAGATDKAYRGTTAMKFTGNPTGGGNASGAVYSAAMPVVGHVGMFTIMRLSFRYWLASPLTVAAAQGFYFGVQFNTRARSVLGLAGSWGSSYQSFGGKLPDYPTTTIAGAGTWVRVSRLVALAPDVTQIKMWIQATHIAEGQNANPMWFDDIRLDFVDRTSVVPFSTTLNGTTGRILRDGPVPVVTRHPITVTPLASTAGRVYVTPGTGVDGQRLTVFSTDAADTTQAVQVNVHAGYSWSDMVEPADGA